MNEMLGERRNSVAPDSLNLSESAAPEQASAAALPVQSIRLRHDLRTVINHLVGYGEMTMQSAEDAGFAEMAVLLAGLCADAKALLAPVTTITSPDVGDEEAKRLQHGLFESAKVIQAAVGTAIEFASQHADDEMTGDLKRLRAASDHLLEMTGSLSSGASFVIDTPTASPEAAQPERAVRLVAPQGGASASTSVISKGIILVVDDDPSNRDLLVRRLEKESFTVLQASCGRQALAMLRQNCFDLVLLDLMMPDIDGVTVLRNIRQSPATADMPVIMISASDEISSVAQCIEQGADDHLSKPFEPVILHARVNALFDRKRLRDAERAKTRELEAALREIEHQRRIAEDLLLNILPRKVAEELREKGEVDPMYFEDATIVFTDFVGFTLSSEKLPAEELVYLLHKYFVGFDRIISGYGLEKLKTIGDSYMFAGGVPEHRPSHPVDAVLAAVELVDFVQKMAEEEPSVNWKVRVGIHTGPVIAGVVGTTKFAFDVWGETVNFGSRMESSGQPNRINISERTYSRVKDFFQCEHRGPVRIKDGREVEMYFVTSLLPSLLPGDGASMPPAFKRRYKVYFQKEPSHFPACLTKGVKLFGDS